MNKQELTKSYSEKIASLFSAIDEFQVSSSTIENALNGDILYDNIDQLLNEEHLIIDYAEQNSYLADKEKVNSFVKENFDKCQDAFDLYTDELFCDDDNSEIDIAERLKTYLFHKGDADNGEVSNADLAYWGLYENTTYKVLSAIRESQNLLDEYLIEMRKLTRSNTDKTK